MTDQVKRVHVRIEGVVQGVFFRAHTQEQAQRLGLNGWVRNRPDGSVEAVMEGEASRIEQMIQWCHEGPPMSNVTHVEVSEQEPLGERGGFSIKYG